MKRERGNVLDLGSIQNRIGEGTKLKGDISSDNGFRIDGEVEGKIESQAKVVIGKNGKVKGTLICKDADIEGTFNGVLQVKNLLALKKSSHIEGDVVTDKLSVEPGAIFQASCAMKNRVKSLGDDIKKETEQSA